MENGNYLNFLTDDEKERLAIQLKNEASPDLLDTLIDQWAYSRYLSALISMVSKGELKAEMDGEELTFKKIGD